jgi:hypothetical protein
MSSSTCNTTPDSRPWAEWAEKANSHTVVRHTIRECATDDVQLQWETDLSMEAQPMLVRRTEGTSSFVAAAAAACAMPTTCQLVQVRARVSSLQPRKQREP